MKALYIYILLLHFSNIGNITNEQYHPLIQRKTMKNEALDTDQEMPQCDEEKLMSFLAELGAINPESIVNLPFQTDVEQVCRRVTIVLDQIDEYLQTCNLPLSEDLYTQLIKGIKALHDSICKSNRMHKKFTKYFPCYKNLTVEYLQCQGPPDWTENNNTKFICENYQDIADCYFIKTAKLCGMKAATVVKSFLTSIIGKIIYVSCPQIEINPVVLDPMPEYGRSKIFTISLRLPIALLIIPIFV